MGDIVVTEFISLDGVIEDPGGSENTERGGWNFDFDIGDGAQFKLDETRSSDALLLGRVTYEGFAEAWPAQEGEFADLFNTIPKHVVSSNLSHPKWNNSSVVTGDLETAVRELKDSYARDVVVHGSARLVQSLLELDLIDELRLMVFPLILGTGKRLWGETSEKHTLSLRESRSVGKDGVIILIYNKQARD